MGASIHLPLVLPTEPVTLEEDKSGLISPHDLPKLLQISEQTKAFSPLSSITDSWFSWSYVAVWSLALEFPSHFSSEMLLFSLLNLTPSSILWFFTKCFWYCWYWSFRILVWPHFFLKDNDSHLSFHFLKMRWTVSAMSLGVFSAWHMPMIWLFSE